MHNILKRTYSNFDHNSLLGPQDDKNFIVIFATTFYPVHQIHDSSIFEQRTLCKIAYSDFNSAFSSRLVPVPVRSVLLEFTRMLVKITSLVRPMYFHGTRRGTFTTRRVDGAGGGAFSGSSLGRFREDCITSVGMLRVRSSDRRAARKSARTR